MDTISVYPAQKGSSAIVPSFCNRQIFRKRIFLVFEFAVEDGRMHYSLGNGLEMPLPFTVSVRDSQDFASIQSEIDDVFRSTTF